MCGEDTEALSPNSHNGSNSSCKDSERPEALDTNARQLPPSLWSSLVSWVVSSWKILLILTFLTIITPIILVTSPVTITAMQSLLGCGLAAATWVIVKFPTEKAQERIASDRVKPEMHLVLGTLLPELAVNLEKCFFWIDLALRGQNFPVFLRYPILNFVAYLTGPLWFALIMVALLFFLLVVTVISFGLVLPFVIPILGLLLGYAIMVPVWVISVYIFTFPPLFISSLVGSFVEVYQRISELREQARARKMVKPRSQVQRGGGLSSRDGRPTSPAAQRNPSPGQPWLTKKELLKLYQDRGLLSPPQDPTSAAGSAPNGPSTPGQAQSDDYGLGEHGVQR
mmetsp:Transcript_6999/g.13900  ORF Transcript_6999/g.13900 Transcript_6999/m.13900 type:complete len:340 (-) Transcript_6999:254-1273(-)